MTNFTKAGFHEFICGRIVDTKKMCCQLTQCDLAERELQKNYNWGNINVGRVKW